MGETETTTPAEVETSPAATSNPAEEETTIAPEETTAAEEVTSAADTSEPTSGAASLDTDTGADQETTSSGDSQKTETETQPVAGEDSSPSEEDDISYPDYSEVLENIYVVAEGQKVLLEDFIAGRTEEQTQAAELNAQRFDLLIQKLDQQSKQLEACISFMVIFTVIVLLNYCYKFIKIFL